MTTSSTRARHRSAQRPTTPLNDFADAASESMGAVGRRTAVVAATSGIFLGMLAVPANAAPNGGAAGALPSVDTAALTASARAVLDTAPVVTAPIDAQWSADTPTVTAVKAPVTRAAARASRTATRTAVATATTTAAAPVATSAVPQSVSGNAVLEIAAQYVGTPYVSGGASPSGFDCSGFTSYVYAQLGITLPRTAAAQKGAGTIVSRADAQPGDLIYSPGHISIYAGDGQQIDAPRPGKSVQFRSIWQSNPVFIRIG